MIISKVINKNPRSINSALSSFIMYYKKNRKMSPGKQTKKESILLRELWRYLLLIKLFTSPIGLT